MMSVAISDGRCRSDGGKWSAGSLHADLFEKLPHWSGNPGENSYENSHD